MVNSLDTKLTMSVYRIILTKISIRINKTNNKLNLLNETGSQRAAICVRSESKTSV